MEASSPLSEADQSRVLAIAIVRDCYSGSRMAQVTSLAFFVVMAVPIAAPMLGHLMHAESLDPLWQGHP